MSIKISLLDRYQVDSNTIDFLKKNINALMREETFRWQYNEILNGAIIYIAKDDLKLISIASFLPYKILFGNGSFLTAKGENFFLDESYRGSPIFAAIYKKGLMECEKRDMCIIWGFSPIYKQFLGKSLFTIYGDIIYDFRAVVGLPAVSQLTKDKKSFLKFFQNSSAYFISEILIWKLKLSGNPAKHIKNYTVLDKLSDLSQIDELFKKIADPEKTVRLSMDKAFLDWRVYKNPNLHYKTFFFFKKGVLEGFYVFSTNKNNRCAQLVEMLFNDKKAGNILICHLIKEMKNEKVQFLEYLGNIKNGINKNTFSLLKKYFFGRMYLNSGMDFIQKITPETKNFPIENWYINGLWTQGYER
ncbi:MAG TPA: hypothetical protein PLB59_01435 [Bacteroidales bacterium]|nr:hypothetical protein [Bacteroidales bacterium]HQP14605.1 hypothetical protein [Bacteroidales bacterium]